MKKIVVLAMTVAVVLPWLNGCGKSDPNKVNARSPVAPAKMEKVISRWKEADLRYTGYGMIVEQAGNSVSAILYRVEPGEGFVIKEKEADGKFYPDKQQIVFPLYMQGIFSVDDWVAAQGSHVVVPFNPQATSIVQTTNLVGELKDMARKSTYNFVRLPSEALPSVLNAPDSSAR